MQCPHCGTPLDDATKRCPSCGRHQGSDPAPVRWPLWLIGAVAVCLVVAGLITAGTIVSHRAKPTQPVVVPSRTPVITPHDTPGTEPIPDPGNPAQSTKPSGHPDTPKPKINDIAAKMLPDPKTEMQGVIKEMDIFGAIRDRDDARVEQILRKHPDLAAKRNYKGATPLHLAAALEDERMVNRLIACKADINAKCDQEMLRGQTALHIAAGRNCTKVMRILLDHGARVNARDVMAATPLHEAASHGSLDAAALLLKSGAAIDAKQADGQTPLFWTAVGGNVKVTRLLLDKGAEINARDYSELTPLTYAVALGKKDIANLLRKEGGKE